MIAQSSPKIIWTRPVDYWEEDSLHFDNPQDVLRVPCVNYRPVDLSTLSLPSSGTNAAWVVTSRRAATMIKSYEPLCRLLQGQTVYTFGAKTAKDLEDSGMTVKLKPCASALELFKSLADLRDSTFNSPACIQWLTGNQRLADVDSFLQSQESLTVNVITIYRSENGAWEPTGGAWTDETVEERYRLLQNISEGSVVCFASPSAAEGFFTAFQPQWLVERSMGAAVIGQSTKKHVESLFSGTIHVAGESSSLSLVQCAEGVLAQSKTRCT